MCLISSRSSMIAMTFISPPHFGQTKWSTSYTFTRRRITRTFPGIGLDFPFTFRERFVAKFLRDWRGWARSLPSLRRSLGEVVQRLKHIKVVLEVVRIGCVEQHATFERFVRDFLQ